MGRSRNKLIHEWLYSNDIFMYSTHNEGNSAIAEKFIKSIES